MIKSLFSRLVDYTPGTAELVPSLAESFNVAPDGLTYTFKLRKGVKFSNGREVVAADVKYSIERAVNPKTQGPGAGFFGAIAGFDDLSAGKAETLAGIETPDAHTVVFKLSRPDATFLHVMAINFASVVPKEAVDAAGADFGKKPVGSGAFTLKEWVIGQKRRLREEPQLLHQGHAEGRRVHGRNRPGTAGRAVAPAEGRSGYRRRRHPARQIPGDEERDRTRPT